MAVYRNLSALRRAIEREHRVTLAEEEWNAVIRVARVQQELALDHADFEAVSSAVQQSSTFQRELASDVRAIREILALANGPETHALSLFAFRKLRNWPARSEVPSEPVDLAEAAGLGRLLLSCIAAQRLADYRGIDVATCLFAILAGPDGVPYGPPPRGHWAREGLAGFIVNPVVHGHKIAFGDLRRTPVSADLEFVAAVERVVRRERRAVTALPKDQRWGHRLDRFERRMGEYSGRRFRDSKNPAHTFRMAFYNARKRVLAVSGSWPAIERIK